MNNRIALRNLEGLKELNNKHFHSQCCRLFMLVFVIPQAHQLSYLKHSSVVDFSLSIRVAIETEVTSDIRSSISALRPV